MVTIYKINLSYKTSPSLYSTQFNEPLYSMIKNFIDKQ